MTASRKSEPAAPVFGVGRAAELRRHTPRCSSLPHAANALPTPSDLRTGAAPDRPARSCLVLLELQGSRPGAVFQLNGKRTTIGRRGSADVMLDDPTVSWEHARLTIEPDGVDIEDLGSRNGTFINDRRVQGRARLHDGDYLRLGGGNTIVKFSMMDELERRALCTLFELTLRDPLTRLYNRRYFDDRLLSEFAFAERQRTELALLLIDIDHFKHFNDTFGHQVGDVVLRLVASSIQKMMRPEDVLARYGGEEFVVIARGTSLRNVHILGDRLCHQIRSLALNLPDRGLRVTVSIGAACMGPGEASRSAQALLKSADHALFEAKGAGRDQTSSARRGET
jgi:two-component system cell cycle response regulator